MTTNWVSNFIAFDIPLIYIDPGFKEDQTPYPPLSYRTPEHFYQAMKSLSHNEHKLIADAKTAAIAKKLGKTINIRPDWNNIKLNVMNYALTYKFTKNTSHGQKLIKTLGPIIEYNYWHDNYWGNCTCEKCKNIPGQNYLGQILEAIRIKISMQI